MRIITRDEWEAPPLNAAKVRLPWSEVVLHTEAGAVLPGDWDELTALAETLSLTEKEHARSIDRYHRVSRGWPGGFGYSFLIERDGTIIEGRGWGRQGAHTQQGRNSTAMGLCFAGHGDLQAATDAQWEAARWLIGEGIRLGHLTPNPKITGHRNYTAKTCPGNLNYPHLDRLRGITGPVDAPTQEDHPMAQLTDAEADALRADAANASRAALTAVGEAAAARKAAERCVELLEGRPDNGGKGGARRPSGKASGSLIARIRDGVERLEGRRTEGT